MSFVGARRDGELQILLLARRGHWIFRWAEVLPRLLRQRRNYYVFFRDDGDNLREKCEGLAGGSDFKT